MYKLLIVDDEPLIRRGIKKLVDLNSLDIKEIFEASNGLEAFDIFKKYKPEIILLDINMPQLDGLSLAEKIKTLNPRTKIAIITGYNYFEYAQRAIKIGVNDYILKPISRDDVSKIIAKLVASLKESKKEIELEKILSNRNKNNLNKENIIENTYENLIKKIIEENYMKSEFTLSVLAETLNISSGYLSGLFKKLYGITFQNYLLEKRMEKAQILLLTTNLKNYEIAEQIGFEDVNYFGSKFKKYYKISPKQYKELILQNEDK